MFHFLDSHGSNLSQCFVSQSVPPSAAPLRVEMMSYTSTGVNAKGAGKAGMGLGVTQWDALGHGKGGVQMGSGVLGNGFRPMLSPRLAIPLGGAALKPRNP